MAAFVAAAALTRRSGTEKALANGYNSITIKTTAGPVVLAAGTCLGVPRGAVLEDYARDRTSIARRPYPSPRSPRDPNSSSISTRRRA